MFPIWAWAARTLLDTEPGTQRQLSRLALGSGITQAVGGLLAACLMNACIAALVLATPVVYGLSVGVDVRTVGLAIALNLLSACAATLVGAWTCRVIFASSAVSILALLGGCVGILLLSMGPLAWVSVPMIAWLRAGHDGPAAFDHAFPGLAAHLLGWIVAVTAAYLVVRRRRP